MALQKKTDQRIGSFDKEIVLKDFEGENGCIYNVDWQ